MRARWLLLGAAIIVACWWLGFRRFGSWGATHAPGEKAEVALPPPPDAAAPEPVPPKVTRACKHPYIPSTVGSRLRYSLTRAGSKDQSTFDYQVESVEDGSKGLVVRWRLEASRVGASQVPPPALAERICDPEGAAEDPWFGANMNLGRVSEQSTRWQWPRELATGQSVKGEVVVESRDGEAMHIARTNEVLGQDEVQVPAGRFQAWRVAFQEETRVGSRTFKQKGTAWLASGVGLVKLQADDDLGAATQELIEYKIAPTL
jgi:hypothetical protein